MLHANPLSGSLADQVTVVTGAGRGVGRAIALALGRAGATVVAVARTRFDVDETVALISQSGGKGWAAAVDVTDRPVVDQLIHDVLDETGRIDVLVNCAGSFTSLDPVWETDPELWWRDVTTNLLGTFLCTRSVLPAMINRRTGTIINLSGGGADGPAPYWTGYASSKAAILRFTDSLAPEVARYSIQVYALLPGLVRTAMTEALLRHPRVAEYAPWFPAAFERGSDIPPEEAGRLAVCLANLRDSRLSGRVFTVGTDVVDLEKRANEIASNDLYALRVRTPPPGDMQVEPPTHQNKALIRRLFVEVVNQQKVDLLDDMVRPEFKVSPNGPSGPHSMKDLISWLHTVFADLHYELEDLVAEADKVVARTRARGIHSGTYLGVRATGRSVSYTETFTFRIADRRIAEWWTEVNRLGILQQIGVTLTDGAPDLGG